MTDSATLAWLDQEDEHITQMIRRHGYFVQFVLGCTCGTCGEPPPFAYTVGLFGLGHPELLVLGMSQGTVAALFNDLYGRVQGGRDLLPGELLTFADWPHRVMVEAVPNPGEIAFSANRHYRRPSEVSVPLLQLTWDDTAGRFPWDPGYSVPPAVQPRPGTFVA